MSLQQTVRTRTWETCIEELMNNNLVKDKIGDLLAYSHNVHNVSDVKQI
jgi:hypothetical protein